MVINIGVRVSFSERKVAVLTAVITTSGAEAANS
jgi:hypothetical protein